MIAVYVRSISAEDPLSGLGVGERPDPDPPQGWAVVRVRAAALNHHDLWALRGPGLREDQLPMILGTDAAGVDEDGNEVIVHPVISRDEWRGDETLDPEGTLLSDLHQGAMAERVMVPRRNLVPKPAGLSFEEAACLPSAWLTAYRMLFVKARAQPGQTVLVQGAGGGVATAAIALGRVTGLRIWVTSRDESKRARALEQRADQAFATGARLPERVDVVLETVGEATWGHSLRSLRPGGTLVVAGATSGFDPPAELARLFFLQLNVLGSKVGTRDELVQLLRLLEDTGVRPVVDRVLPLAEARAGFEAMASGDLFGKIVFTP
ncbi:zinc-binding dehydrogenase [Conexibacter stalactiti]|uniref:Zinc-binding dehydrogenase n=1 Tax=Conexibacter stalactiti TaxID=1940611 RepID=A0ABU4HWC0_9ACTN|nr:zinc-binding dehydrogenase [Conexibacter stalactiti]MDW5597621.1 zinc-binding dehydrogenase [Conexibacter stalactiti]MEC5038263.1 zinc-binding dehydrogenase [Conexibacter stalactiti]